MKTTSFKIFKLLSFVLVISLIATSCKTKQKVVPQAGEVEVLTPCSGPDFQSTSKVLRFSAIGESMDQMTAKKKAMSEARAGLAASVSTLVKGVTDNYVKSGNYSNKEELMKNYEGMNREVVNQTLNGITVICEKTMLKKDNTYKYYVCAEIGGSEVLQSMNKKMTANEMLKVDYNYEKFKKTFEEEMSKMGN